MRYRIIILFWIIFLIFSNLYQIEYFSYNNLVEGTKGLIYEPINKNEEQLTSDDLPLYDEVEYFLIKETPTKETYIYANDTYYKDLGLTPPKDNEYYGKGEIEGLNSIGPGPYIDLGHDTYYLNTASYRSAISSNMTLFYYRSDNKEKMYNVETELSSDSMRTVPITLDKMPSLYYIACFLVNIFFLLLTFMLLFVDVSLYQKEMAISKILGYNSLKILAPKLKQNIIYSLIYFLALLLPLILINYDGSIQIHNFLYSTLFKIIKFYIFFNIIYGLVYVLFIYKIHIVSILKGKLNSSIINSMSICTNILSKILIIGILVILILPTYQVIKTYNQYTKYIKGYENFVKYNAPTDKPKNTTLAEEYDKYNEKGAILNTRIDNGLDYIDTSEYIDDSYQISTVNHNYIDIIKPNAELDESKNYLLVPYEMESSIDEIENTVRDANDIEDYEIKYYNSQPIYTYAPLSYYETSGYIYYPIMLVLSDLDSTYQDSYVMQSLYYENSNPSEESRYLTEEFSSFSHTVIKSATTLFILFILFIIVIIISTYYMVISYLQINGKEIAVKRILGYSRFKIYTKFYILDFICYVAGSIALFYSGCSLLVPYWLIILFIFIMIILNEMNRKLLIKKCENGKIINIIKGDI